MGFLRGRAERKFYRSLDDQHLLVADAAIEFFSTVKELLGDPEDQMPEAVFVTVTLATDAPRPASDLCLVGQFIAKISSNLHGSPPQEALWAELSECSGRWGGGVGPDHLQIVETRPRKPRHVYRAKLYESPNGWIVFTPYEGRGGEGYYSLMSVFALIRSVRADLGQDAGKLDLMLDRLTDQSDRLINDSDDTWSQMMCVQDAMQEIGVAHARQLLPEDT